MGFEQQINEKASAEGPLVAVNGSIERRGKNKRQGLPPGPRRAEASDRVLPHAEAAEGHVLAPAGERLAAGVKGNSLPLSGSIKISCCK
jgi:hypothetical protein